MELQDRIAAVRKAAGLTQEQLGELVGVTRQAVSKWESGQATPDAVTVAALCQALHVSADYLLLGKEPEPGGAAPTDAPLPDTCPCCGRDVPGNVCPVCGYTIPIAPLRGPRYAVVAKVESFYDDADKTASLVRYCGMTEEQAAAAAAQTKTYGAQLLLRRDLPDSAALWVATHMRPQFPQLTIVEDWGEEEDALLIRPKAMELPEPPKAESGGIGFLGVVGAVIVALLILSVF